MEDSDAPTFIDLFAGCGGLSLGLMSAGWQGIFAIEKSPRAFKTLRHNLIEEGEHNIGRPHFNWPNWLQKKPYEVSDFLRVYKQQLYNMRGHVHLVAGGPPCQGFSFAGKRIGDNPKNELFKYQVEIVSILKPKLVLIENVKGIETVFGKAVHPLPTLWDKPSESYAHHIRTALEEHGYKTQLHSLEAANFGVPQSRLRYFILGVRQDPHEESTETNLLQTITKIRSKFLEAHGLPVWQHVTVADAISDLVTTGKQLVECVDDESPRGFKEIVYEGPTTTYQKLMHTGMNGHSPNSLRLVNHRPKTIERFQAILRTCRKGMQLVAKDRMRLGIKKASITPFTPNKPAPTITTIPDDFLHYSEPRVHTVREHARLQSFPDWFEFRGKYTTGANMRTIECPRYTQVGNAVPPLLAEAIGVALLQ